MARIRGLILPQCNSKHETNVRGEIKTYDGLSPRYGSKTRPMSRAARHRPTGLDANAVPSQSERNRDRRTDREQTREIIFVSYGPRKSRPHSMAFKMRPRAIRCEQTNICNSRWHTFCYARARAFKYGLALPASGRRGSMQVDGVRPKFSLLCPG